MPDFSKARVGDRVWSIHGIDKETNATIKDIDTKGEYIIIISYDGYLQDGSYTIEGKQYKNDTIPSLYWSRPTITGGDVPPKRMVKKAFDRWAVFSLRRQSIVGELHETLTDAEDEKNYYVNSMSPKSIYDIIHIHHEYEVEE